MMLFCALLGAGGVRSASLWEAGGETKAAAEGCEKTGAGEPTGGSKSGSHFSSESGEVAIR